MDKYEKVKYFVIDENYTEEEKELADNSPNTRGASHWKREFLQKESIKKALTHLKDDDIVIVGDVDEIPEMDIVLKWCHAPFKWRMKVYTYWLNNCSSEEFWGFICSPYKHIRSSCLNDLRNNSWKTVMKGGWHFTSMHHQLAKKLKDSYTEEDYAHPRVLSELEENIKSNKDFIGRDFKFWVDESDLPEYIINHRHLYQHLLK